MAAMACPGRQWNAMVGNAHLDWTKQVSMETHLEVEGMLEKLIGGKVTAASLLGAGDSMLVLMKKYLSNGMHMNEQIDRNTGVLLSAKDLTWNYANILKAMKARTTAADALKTTVTV